MKSAHNLLDVLCFVLKMENTEKSSETANSAAFADLENILQRLKTLSNHMDLLARMYHTESNQSSRQENVLYQEYFF